MVMENEIRLGDIMDKLTPSDRVVIYNAAGSRNKVYGWEVADVKEYPRAVTLEELGIKRAPQSWQYMR